MRVAGTSTAVATVAAVLVAVSGCGGSPTQQGAGSTSKKDTPGLEEVYAQLEGLTGDARTKKLVALAKAEKGEFSVYYTNNEAADWIKAFEKQYGLTVKGTEGSPDDILTRITQEANAGNSGGADFVEDNELQTTVMDQQLHVFDALKSPTTGDIDPQYLRDTDTFFPIYAASYAVSWNSKTVKNPPTSWPDVLKIQKGLVFEVTDWPWFATIIKDWLVPKAGMTQAQAISAFKSAAKHASAASGHTLMVQLVASGEYQIAPSAYEARVQQLHDDTGAPLAWQPVVDPMVERREGAGIIHGTDRPATAVLFGEYLLTKVQDLLDPNEDIPVVKDKQGKLPTSGHTVILEDAKYLLDNQKFWQDTYDSVMHEISGPVREK